MGSVPNRTEELSVGAIMGVLEINRHHLFSGIEGLVVARSICRTDHDTENILAGNLPRSTSGVEFWSVWTGGIAGINSTDCLPRYTTPGPRKGPGEPLCMVTR